MDCVAPHVGDEQLREPEAGVRDREQTPSHAIERPPCIAGFRALRGGVRMGLTRGWSVGLVIPTVLIGILLSLGVFRLASGWETARAEDSFRDLADAEVARPGRNRS